MSTTIQIKRSSTASAVPIAGDLAVGELAVNLADKRLFAKQADGTIIELSTNPTDLDAATLRIDGVEITASATELNKLDGFTGSTAELNLLDGLTATTIELNTLDGITASTAELNKLDGYTGSTAELNILDGVTATTAELNKLDGFTGTVADLNYAKDLRATGVTTAELDVLDGITATTAELNYVDGVTSNIQTQLDSMVEKAGDTMTGDLSLGDNVKAKFGASDDLQIYHNGSTSVIEDAGTGNLQIRAQDFYITNPAGTELLMGAVVDGAVDLYHNNSKKLATTSTGVDVTGTVTADGLTIDGGGTIEVGSGGFNGRLNFPYSGRVNIDSDNNGTGEKFTIGSNQTGDGATNQIAVFRESGDVEFYEDTGTTAKMVWDASAESLRSPIFLTANDQNSYVTDGYCAIYSTGAGGAAPFNEAGHLVLQARSSGALRDILFATGNGATERMRIDSAGNVGIGTASPSSALEINGVITQQEGNVKNTVSSTPTGLEFTANSGSANVSRSFVFKSSASGGGVTEKARLDSSGNLLVGKTTTNTDSVGFEARATGLNAMVRDGGEALVLGRKTNDGSILSFRKDGTTVGSIGSYLGAYPYLTSSTNKGLVFGVSDVNPCGAGGVASDGEITLGASTRRFKDLYLSGGVYLGGTGAANKLDSYEEGVWNPTVGGVSVAGTTTYTVQKGSYTKVGNVVHINAYVGWSDIVGSTGYLILGGLPFLVSGDSDRRYSSITMGYAQQTTWGSGTPSLHTKPSSTEIYIGSSVSGGNWTNTAMTTSGDLIISGTYRTDS